MYLANEARYGSASYNYCGKSGLKLPAVSLGLWHNFSFADDFANMERMCRTAFDLGIIHFDLANNYGNPYNGSAEENFGKILGRGLRAYRDELCVSTKAGYGMWDGPYGDWGSRKYLFASLDQSLKRMNIDYVDIFYHHRPDPNTPIEETVCALDQIVRSGKALYIGLSNYKTEHMKAALPLMRELKIPFVICQPSYSILNRWIEEDGLDKLAVEEGFGLAVFSPLNSGLLTSRYRDKTSEQAVLTRLEKLNGMASSRGQTLSQMALSWVLSNKAVTTVLIGASSPEQIAENIKAAERNDFSREEKNAIDAIIL